MLIRRPYPLPYHVTQHVTVNMPWGLELAQAAAGMRWGLSRGMIATVRDFPPPPPPEEP